MAESSVQTSMGIKPSRSVKAPENETKSSVDSKARNKYVAPSLNWTKNIVITNVMSPQGIPPPDLWKDQLKSSFFKP